MSEHRRFFVPPESINGQGAELSGALAHQILRVLRLREGDTVVLLDGTGIEYAARVERQTRETISLIIQGSRQCELEPAVEVGLAVCLPKADKLELVVQKCTELGISELIAVESERTVSRPPPARLAGKMQRWGRIAAEAAEQCGRGRAPVVERCLSFDELVDIIPDYDLALVAWEEERGTSLKHVIGQYSCRGPMLLIIGPEGGLTQQEVESAVRAGARSVSLGRRVLRVDTAAIAATAAVMYELDGSPAGNECSAGNSELDTGRQGRGVTQIDDGSQQ